LESSETGFSEYQEILKIVLFQNFQKLQKNDVKLELRKLQKTRSDSKTDLKVRLKVQIAGPYCNTLLETQWNEKKSLTIRYFKAIFILMSC